MAPVRRSSYTDINSVNRPVLEVEVNVDEQVKSSTAIDGCFTPAFMQRSARWQIQPMLNTFGCRSQTRVRTEFLDPIITLQLSLAKPMQFRQGISSLLYNKIIENELSTNIYHKTMFVNDEGCQLFLFLLLYYK